jgi:protein TonB
MERPNHLAATPKSAASRASSLVIVAIIHVAVIGGLVIALNQSAVLKKISEIKASVETPKEPPKAPPPPPPDLVKPPPPVAIVPEFNVATAAPPPVTVVKSAPTPPAPPPAAPAAPRISDTKLVAVMRTHVQPTYPAISVRLNEQGVSLIEVHITTEGNVDDCKIVKTSSSDRLDQAACDYVKSHWRWQPPTSQGQPTAASTQIQITWNLKDAR